MPSFLVLAHADDPTAYAVADALARRHGPRAAELVLMDQLLPGATWAHRLATDQTHTHVRLPDGRLLAADALGVVFNRLRYTPIMRFATAADREYAAMESFALLLSWLASLPCPVVNPASPRGLAGADRPLAEWLAIAASCGLPVRHLRFTTNARRFAPVGLVPLATSPQPAAPTPPGVVIPRGPRPARFAEPAAGGRRLLVAGDRVLGTPSPWWTDAGRRLARHVSCSLLEIQLVATDGGREGWAVAAIDAFPHAPNPAAIQAIVALLEAQLAERSVPSS